MSALTIQDLESRKTALCGELARCGTQDTKKAHARLIGAKIDMLDELIRSLKPKPLARTYMVLYSVTWQPENEDDIDAPLDQQHQLIIKDERVIDREMVEIGNARVVLRALENIV